MRNIVNALFLRDGAVLLARRSPHRRAYPGLWSAPGGHVEAGESLTEALVREVREEVGAVPTSFTFLTEIADPNAPESDPATYYLYGVTTWDGGEPTLLGDEHSELKWIALGTAITIPELALEEYRLLFRHLTTNNALFGGKRS